MKTAYFHSFRKYRYFMLVTNPSQMMIQWYSEVMECPMYDEAVVVNVFHVASLIFLGKKKSSHEKEPYSVTIDTCNFGKANNLRWNSNGNGHVSEVEKCYLAIYQKFPLMSQLALQICGFNNVFPSEFNNSLHQSVA